MEGGDARRVRLDLAQLVACETAQAGHTVLQPAPMELVEPPELALIRRDDYLAAALRANAVFVAERVHEVGAATAERRLQGARCVVDALMNDAAVATRLVARDLRFTLE